MDSSTITLWTGLFPNVGCLVSSYYYDVFFFIEIPVFNTNSVDPDQMLHPAASDLGLLCLLIALFGGLQTKMG